MFKLLSSPNPTVKRDLVRVLARLLCFSREQRVQLGLSEAATSPASKDEFDHGLGDLWVSYLLSQSLEK